MSIINNQEFYQNASTALLSTVQIEKSAQNCLLYLREFMPADFFSVHLFDGGLGVVETVVDATVEESELISQITTLSPEARQTMQMLAEMKSPECIIFDRVSENEMARQLGLDLKTPDAPCIAMDLVVDDMFVGIVSIVNNSGVKYTKEHSELLLSIHDPLAVCCNHFIRFRELSRLKDILSDNARQLQKDLMHDVGEELIGADFGLRQVMEKVEHVAAQGSSVLLLGETGCGKEVVALAVHRLSAQREGPFIKVNCGAIPPGLIESELFGHEKGAFTGAISTRRGCFERADGGTLLLDEIGELPLEAQVRLLRVLQDRTVERIGASRPEKVDVRVVAATNRNLEAMVEVGEFRRDLFFRLNVFPIHIPPLRERRFDIPALAHHLINKKSREMGLQNVPTTKPGAVDHLTEYDWPGNVRELENVIEREIILRPKGPLTFTDFRPRSKDRLPEDNEPDGPVSLDLDNAIVRHITRVLKMTKGKVEGPGGAAGVLNVNPRTLQYRMKKLGIPFGRSAKGIY